MATPARVLLVLSALVSIAADEPHVAGEASDRSPHATTVEILAFTADWCGPCRKLAPLLRRLVDEGYPLRFIDVDKDRELAKKHRITSIPALVAFAGGREVDRTIGSPSESALRRLATCAIRAVPSSETVAVSADASPTGIAGAVIVEPLLRVTYTAPQPKAEALVKLLTKHSEVEFDAEIAGETLRLTATPETQRALGPFLRDVLAKPAANAPVDGKPSAE